MLSLPGSVGADRLRPLQVGWHDPPGAAASFLSVTHGLIDAAASLCERADGGAADEDARSSAIEAFGARTRNFGRTRKAR